MSGIDANTTLCLHCDGSDASTTFTDSSSAAHTVTANGNAQVDTAQSVFGGAAALFDGTGDYLSTADSADWAFGSGDFTVDFRIRWNGSVATATFLRQGLTSGQFSWRVTLTAPNQLNFTYSTDGTANPNLFVTWAPAADTWYHLAVVRTGTTLKFFVDGSQVGADQTLSGTLFDSNEALTIGARSDGTTSLAGWMDEIRVSKGVARWTSNFTPPTAAYSVGDSVDGDQAAASATGAAGTIRNDINLGGVRAAATATAVAARFVYYPYVNLVPSYDLDLVFNRWTVTRQDGSPQTDEDTASQAEYFLRAKQTQTLVSTDAAALAQAQRKIAKYKQPIKRIDSMTVMPLTDLTNTAQIDASLGRELGDVVTIKETPPGFGAVQTRDYVIQSVSGQIQMGPMVSMTLTFGVSPV